MVSVACYHTSQKFSVLLVDSCKTVLLNYEDTKSVAYVQKGWGHRIVARTVGVAAEFLQLEKSPFLKTVRDSRTYSGVVLMHIHTLELHYISVQEEASVSIEFDVSDTCCGRVGVGQVSVGIYISDDGI